MYSRQRRGDLGVSGQIERRRIKIQRHLRLENMGIDRHVGAKHIPERPIGLHENSVVCRLVSGIAGVANDRPQPDKFLQNRRRDRVQDLIRRRWWNKRLHKFRGGLAKP